MYIDCIHAIGTIIIYIFVLIFYILIIELKKNIKILNTLSIVLLVALLIHIVLTIVTIFARQSAEGKFNESKKDTIRIIVMDVVTIITSIGSIYVLYNVLFSNADGM